MAKTLSVPYTTMWNGGQPVSESVSQEGGPTATVRLKCLWDDRLQLVRDLIGTSIRSGGAIFRDVPFSYPALPGLYCQSCTVEGLGKGFMSRFFPQDGRWIATKYAIVTATFAVPPYSFDNTGQFGEPWTTVNFGMAGEFQTMPDAIYRYADGTPTTKPIGRLIPSMSIDVKRYRLPYSPLAEIASVMGGVNADVFTIAGHDFAAGTLLFEGGDDEIEMTSIGDVTVNVSYKLQFRPIPWNYFPKNARGGTVYQTVTDGSGDFVYPPVDLSILP